MLGNRASKGDYRSGGTRGGQQHFKWDDVKSDKDRENYLGHSAMAPVGRWQKGKDLTWYAKGKSSSEKEKEIDEIAAERQRMRELDEDLINSQLGIKSTRKRTYDTNLESEDIKQFVKKGAVEYDDQVAERIKGLGAAPSRGHEHIDKVSRVEQEIDRLRNGGTGGFSMDSAPTRLMGNASEQEGDYDGAATGRDGGDKDEEVHKGEEKKDKKEKKEMKKEKKEMKKEMKKQKKQDKKEKRHKRHDSDSDSDSDSDKSFHRDRDRNTDRHRHRHRNMDMDMDRDRDRDRR